MNRLAIIWRNAANTVFFAVFALYAGPLMAGTPAPDSEQENRQNQLHAQVTPRSTSSKSVYSVYIQSDDCRNGLIAGLEKAGVRIGQPGDEVDVILTLQLKPQRGWFTQWSLVDDFLQGFMTKASYEVKLIGKGQQILLSLHGQEQALTGREMCQDIGDNIADRLTQRG